MPRAAEGSLVQQIEVLLEGGSVTGLTDRQLLARFTAERDSAREAAFAALVTRHGPMVLVVCRQLLGDLHHAEDAFQAVFLVLARKAGSIRDPDLLCNWLYGVALRTARKAKVRLARQRRHEEGDSMRRPGSGASVSVEPMAQSAEQPALAREQAEALHEEIGRLPGSFRLPVVLCYFEGLTLDEAARRLRWPAGTVRSRLARARDKLRRGLTRRGVVLPAAALAAALGPRSASARISSHLCDATTRAAIQFAAGQTARGVAPTSTAVLAQEVLRSMVINKLRLSLLTVLLLGAVATGAGLLGRSLAMMNEPKRPQAGQQLEVSPNGPSQAAAPGRMFVVGRVLDPQGKPAANASVIVYAVPRLRRMTAIGQAATDGSGRFQLDAPRTSSSAYRALGALATAPGYGAGWVELDPDAEQPIADINLRPEQVIQGQLLDLQGRPAPGVTVTVRGMGRVVRPNSNALGASDGLSVDWARAKNRPAWPRPATTDAEGRFIVHGIGRELAISLAMDDPRFATRNVRVDTDGAANAKTVTITLQPAKIITGSVTYIDTGKPVPHAEISVGATGAGESGMASTFFQADANGRFRVNPSPGDQFRVGAHPPEGQPYLGFTKQIDWPKGAVEHSVDLALPRSVMIRGKLTEAGSGHPIAGAAATYYDHRKQNTYPESWTMPGGGTTADDGSFEFAVPPQPGHLVIRAPSEDYLLEEIGYRLLFEGQPGGPRCYAHAFVACDPKPGGADLKLNVALRRGVTLKGRVIVTEGKPVEDVWMFSRWILGPAAGAWRGWDGEHGITRNGRFELHGLDPDTEVPVHFLYPKHSLGATAHLSGKSASSGLATVRLEPCGTAKARLVNSDGKPLGGFSQRWLISMVVTPGPPRSHKSLTEGLVPADELPLASLDPIDYQQSLVSDSQGRIAFPSLIPGATYRIIDRTTARDETGPHVRKEFTLKPGETVDLGDILIEKPQR